MVVIVVVMPFVVVGMNMGRDVAVFINMGVHMGAVMLTAAASGTHEKYSSLKWADVDRPRGDHQAV